MSKLGDALKPGLGALLAFAVVQQAFGAVHPPAAAYAFLFAMQKMPPVMIVKGPGLLGALVLLAVQQGAYLPALKALEAKGKTA
ncbi:oxidoreductase family [Aureococcus anophagefferens]|nr:oxidoreductase family [Aureococcus anophagefferens]